MTSCPCGSANTYSTCCGVFIEQKQYPSTPDQLMRSRYSAYVIADMDYITNTMQGPAAINFNANEAFTWTTSITWIGLTVVKTKTLGNKGWVEFIASYLTAGKTQQIHELSEFHRINGRWYYIDGTSPTSLI